MMPMTGSQRSTVNVSLKTNPYWQYLREVRFAWNDWISKIFWFWAIWIFQVPCGDETGSYVSNIRTFASSGGTQLGRDSPKACWDVCSNSTCSGVTNTGIVWKNGTSSTPSTCGCVNVMKMHLWTINNSTSADQDAYQFYEPGLNNNFCNGSMPM